MKITWFGRGWFRIHAAEKICLIRQGEPPAGLDPIELASGVDFTVELQDASLPAWTPEVRRPGRLIDQTGDMELISARFDTGVVFTGTDEPLLFLGQSPGAVWGRFADNSVIIVGDENTVEQSESILASSHPRLLLLAHSDLTEDDFGAIAAARARFGASTTVQLLEPRMAAEA